MLSPILPKFSIVSKKGDVHFKYATLDPAMKTKDKKKQFLSHINVEDPFARLYLVRLCGLALGPNETKESVPFVNVLKYLLHDENLMVFLEAANVVMQNQFSLSMEAEVQGGGEVLLFKSSVDFCKNVVISGLAQRLCTQLADTESQIQLHAALRVARQMMIGYVNFRKTNPEIPRCIIIKNRLIFSRCCCTN